MKRLISLLLIIACFFCLYACSAPVSETAPVHKLGVMVYDLTDEEVLAFREYLENYIAPGFQDVEFLYSAAVTTRESAMQFLQDVIDAGAEGILAFNTFDLEKEVNYCAERGVYYIQPSATVDEAAFEAVAENPYFLGVIGPGAQTEYYAGFAMGKYLAETKQDDTYFILSGGACLGNAMHYARTCGILDALEDFYGAEFDDFLAVSSEPITVTEDDFTVTVCGGYISDEGFLKIAKQSYAQNSHSNVLAVLPLAGMADVISDARVGVIDCYNATNERLFQAGKLNCLCGKYQSIIGPAFAAMYNAVTGHADAFRDNGRAFSLQQGFWVSATSEDFEKKYALSSGIALNAYSLDDLMQAIAEYNENANLNTLRSLTDGWEFEAAVERRGG